MSRFAVWNDVIEVHRSSEVNYRRSICVIAKVIISERGVFCAADFKLTIPSEAKGRYAVGHRFGSTPNSTGWRLKTVDTFLPYFDGSAPIDIG